MQKYMEWTGRNSGLDKPLVVIAYASSYGNTRRMAEEINTELLSQGVATKLVDATETSADSLRDQFEIADGILFGSPTFVGDAVKPIWDALNLLSTIAATGKKGAAFGSYGWGGQAVEIIENYLEGLKLKVYKPGAKARLVPSETEVNSCRGFAMAFAQFVKA
jgi:flavorubredoxin